VRALGARHRRHNGGQIQLKHVGVRLLGREVLGVVVDEQIVGAQVGLDLLHLLLGAVGVAQVLDGALVHGEEADSGTILRRHVRDGCAVCQRQLRQSRPEELDELVDHSACAQLLGDRQHQISGSAVLRERAHQAVSDHFRQHHRDGLAQHHSLGLNTADTPTRHTKTVDHGRVRVRTHQRVGVQHAVVLEHDAREVLQVHLVHNTASGRHDEEVAERLAAPLEELEALAVALHLLGQVLGQRIRVARVIDLHGVVHHQIGGHQRVNLVRVTTQTSHRVAHGSKIHHGGHTGEILHQHASRLERNLHLLLAGLHPVDDLFDIRLGDGEVIRIAHCALEQHFDRIGQLLDSVIIEFLDVVVCLSAGQLAVQLLVERIGMRGSRHDVRVSSLLEWAE